jgi:hypothetical protein
MMTKRLLLYSMNESCFIKGKSCKEGSGEKMVGAEVVGVMQPDADNR